jgi:hypothetical protein
MLVLYVINAVIPNNEYDFRFYIISFIKTEESNFKVFNFTQNSPNMDYTNHVIFLAAYITDVSAIFCKGGFSATSQFTHARIHILISFLNIQKIIAFSLHAV